MGKINVDGLSLSVRISSGDPRGVVRGVVVHDIVKEP